MTAVRGPKHVVKRGKTTVLAPEEARSLAPTRCGRGEPPLNRAQLQRQPEHDFQAASITTVYAIDLRTPLAHIKICRVASTPLLKLRSLPAIRQGWVSRRTR